MKILVRRTGALGDVVLTTPIVRRIKRENPTALVSVQTAYPAVFRDNPHAHSVFPPTDLVPYNGISMAGIETHFDHIINLDLAYEHQPKAHIVDAYMLHAFGDTGRLEDKRQELFFDFPVQSMAKRRFVAVHAASAGWRNRTLPQETWVKVLLGIRKMRAIPILVGTDRDMIDVPPSLMPILPRMNVPDLNMQARVIASCSCFVGSDSGLLHVAGATDTPIVGVFTCAEPQFRLPYRDNCLAIVPRDLDCLGCLHRRQPPVTTESCERGDVACVKQVHPDDILDAISKFLT